MTVKTKEKNKGGRPKGKLPSRQVIAKFINEYTTKCEAEKLRPLKSEVAYLLGISKDTLVEYGKELPVSVAIKRLEAVAETYLNRKLDASSANQNAMFSLKANHGYIEAQHVKLDVTSNGETLGVVQLPAR